MGEISKIQLLDGDICNIRDRHYAVCESDASSPYKSVTISNFEIVEGAEITVKFIHTNTANYPVLYITNKHEYPIYFKANCPAGNVPSESWNDGAVVDFVFDGSVWIMKHASGLLPLGLYIDDDGDLCQIDD